MKTTAVRLHGAMDLRLDEFELPALGEKEILVHFITDSLCASTYKAVKLGTDHKRVPPDVAENPVMVGHEMCGVITEVGAAVDPKWEVGQKIIIQTALKLESGYDPGYSYPYIGGASTYAIVPELVLERNCLIPYDGEGYFKASMVEPLACCYRGFLGCYHTDYTTYTRTDGTKKNGKLAILGGSGPMGLGCVELAYGFAGMSQVVVTGRNQTRLDSAAAKCPPSYAREKGCELIYLCTAGLKDPVAKLLEISEGGFDDVFVMAPSAELFQMAEQICREDGCINFFAGPPQHDLQGALNLYRIHYDGIHVLGTGGSIPQDMRDVLKLIEGNAIRPAALISHILGLNAYVDTMMAMATPSGAKKLCYTGLDIPLIALDELDEWGKKDPLYAELAGIVKKNGGLWCVEAEEYLLANAPKI
ncbi:MAG: L-sorbose 1-phosphate reductase [Ruminococcaceae bacterium]|nr:L-sorbose 1-phosphate reductase [Oscillospiraceae bacterium]